MLRERRCGGRPAATASSYACAARAREWAAVAWVAILVLAVLAICPSTGKRMGGHCSNQVGIIPINLTLQKLDLNLVTRIYMP